MSDEYEVHCKYCMCPKDTWDKFVKSYVGDGCKLYSDFSNIIDDFEKAMKPFNYRDILNKCKSEFAHDFNDIPDIGATVKELMEIHNDVVYMPNNYLLIHRLSA